jgi:hypothetical protein
MYPQFIQPKSNIPDSSNINVNFSFPNQPTQNPLSSNNTQNLNYNNSLNYSPQANIGFNMNYQNFQDQHNFNPHSYNNSIIKN